MEEIIETNKSEIEQAFCLWYRVLIGGNDLSEPKATAAEFLTYLQRVQASE